MLRCDSNTQKNYYHEKNYFIINRFIKHYNHYGTDKCTRFHSKRPQGQ